MCFKYVSDYSSSLKWFREAYDHNYGSAAIWEYATALKNNGEYESAKEAFRRFGEESGRNTEARREMNECNLLLEWQNTPGPYVSSVKKILLSKDPSSEYHCVKLKSGSWVFVKEKEPGSEASTKKFDWTGRSYSDLFISDSFQIVPFSSEINSPGNEGPFCFSPGEEEIYFTRCGSREEESDFCHLFYSKSNGGIWNKPVQVLFSELKGNQIHPALHSSGHFLIFSSDDPAGYGGYDLYKSEHSEEGWTKPVNLGSRINTSGNEMFPVWFNDTLFYSSNGLVGLGGLDLFSTYQSNDSSWSPPINLKPPFNSESDDFSLFIDSSPSSDSSIYRTGYFSSNRQNNRVDAIYRVELRNRVIPQDNSEKTRFNYTLYANLRFIPSEEYSPNNQNDLDSVVLRDKLNGSVIDMKSSKLVKLKVLAGEAYRFFIKRSGYLNREIEFITPDKPLLSKDSTVSLDYTFELVPYVFNKEFVLKSLYFDFDKWDLRPDAMKSLEELKNLLITNPKLNVAIGSHTDCRGELIYNYELSLKRAKAAVDWLVLQGINSERLIFKGHGESEPAVNCVCEECTEAQHQLNRRCTFRLIP